MGGTRDGGLDLDQSQMLAGRRRRLSVETVPCCEA